MRRPWTVFCHVLPAFLSGVECALKYLCEGSVSTSANESESSQGSSASRQDDACASPDASTSELPRNASKHAASLIEWSEVSFAAIGETTAKALRDTGWGPHAVAKEPTPGALLAAIDASSR